MGMLGMQIPSDLAQNTSAFLAAVAAAIGAAGLFLALLCGAAMYFSVQGLGAAFLPQVDSAIVAIEDAQGMLSSAEQTASYAGQGLGHASAAFAAYSESSAELGNSLGAIASVPPFSLDPGFASASAKIAGAGASFSAASLALNSSAEGMGNSTIAIRKANEDIGSARERLASAKSELSGAFGIIGIGIAIGTLAGVALFSSVVAISLSILIAYYPKLFEKKEEPKTQ